MVIPPAREVLADLREQLRDSCSRASPTSPRSNVQGTLVHARFRNGAGLLGSLRTGLASDALEQAIWERNRAGMPPDGLIRTRTVECNSGSRGRRNTALWGRS